MKQTAIRPARLEDLKALWRLYEQLDELHRQARPELFRVPPGDRRPLSFLEERINGAGAATFVAERDEALLGLATVILRDKPETLVQQKQHYAEIDEIVVDADQHRQGIATALLDACLSWARQQPGVHKVKLSVHEFNDGARRFYEEKGFATAYRQMELEL